jgi:hypothetical protein
VTSDLPPPAEPNSVPTRPSTRRPRPADLTHLAATGTTKKTMPEGKPAPSEKNRTLLLRSGKPPVDRLDFDDRHDTRATESEEMARLYAALRKDRRRDDWHRLAMRLAVLAVGVAVYLAGFIVVSRQLPHLSPRLAAQIVGVAFCGAGGGAALQSAIGIFKRHTAGRRGRGPKST